jgi:hypothetical protein
VKLDNYSYLGLGFIGFGVLFAGFSYWVLLNIPLTSLGLATVILGATLLLIPSNPVPRRRIRAMVEASLVNIEALLEEFDVMGKAVYLPPVDGRVNAFITVNEETASLVYDNIPSRVLTESSGEPGVLVFSPGSEVVRLALLPEDIGAEDALNSVLVDFTELADAVKAVVELNQVIVEVTGSKSSSDYGRVNNSMGSLPVSVSGSVLAYVYDKPVRYLREEIKNDVVNGFFQLVEGLDG